MLIYVIQFFMQLALSANAPDNPNFGYLTLLLFVSQVVCIALPALLMALMLTGRPRKTLLLDKLPSLSMCSVAVLLALLLHPIGMQVSDWIRYVYPVTGQVEDKLNAFAALFKTAPYPWLPYVLLAVLPAFCEELAFRGFVLSGLRHLGSKWWAIGLSAVFFGMAHGVIQQSLSAVLLGMVLGYLAVQTGCLIPCMLFHVTYNGVMFATQLWPQLLNRQPEFTRLVYKTSTSEVLYRWPVIAVCAAGATVLILWLRRLPYQSTREEQISDARARQPHYPATAAAPGTAE